MITFAIPYRHWSQRMISFLSMKNWLSSFLSGQEESFWTLLSSNGWKIRKSSSPGASSLPNSIRSLGSLVSNILKWLNESKIGIKFITECWRMSNSIKQIKVRLTALNTLGSFMAISIAVTFSMIRKIKSWMSLTLTKFKEVFICGICHKQFLQVTCSKKQECPSVELLSLKLTENSSKVGSLKDMNQWQVKAGSIRIDSKEWSRWKGFFMSSFALKLSKKETFQQTWSLSLSTSPTL